MNVEYRLFIVALCALGLVACGGRQVVKEEQTTAAAAPPAEEPLPKVELTQDVLFDVLLGEIAGRRGDFDVTVSVLTRAAEKTGDPRLAERATQAALYVRRYAEAAASARIWAQLRPDSIEAQEALGAALLGLNDTGAAQRHFERELALASQQDRLGTTFLRVASILGQQQNRASAFSVMRALVEKHPDDANAHFALAHLAIRAEEPAQARSSIDAALERRPEWEEAALFKVRVLISQDDKAGAQAFFEEYLRRHPRATRVRTNYARYLVDLKQWGEARAQFKRVVKDVPDDADAMLAVGLLSLQINELDEAETYLKRHLKLRPDSDQARLYLGQVAEQRKNYKEAARWYSEVTGDGYYFDAQTRMAIAVAKQGDLEGARRLLHTIQTENDQQRIQLVLAEEQLLRESKRYDEAHQVLTTELKRQPGNSDLLYARALVAEKLDKIDMLERDLRTILKQDPQNVHALNALGYTLADRTTRYAEAKALLSKAIKLKPDDPFILDSMGWLEYRLGNYDAAINYLRRALAEREDAEISAHLGEVLWMAGERGKALSVWRRALKQTPDNESLISTMKKFDL